MVHMQIAMVGSMDVFTCNASDLRYHDTYAKCYVCYVDIIAWLQLIYANAFCCGAPLVIPKKGR